MAAEAPPSISTHVAVLGDSLSVAGYGIGRVEDTWPRALQSELGHGVCISVHAQGRLACSVELKGKTYYGHTKWLGTAQNTPADMYLIMLGTNDIQSAGCTLAGMVQGYSRIVLMLRASAKAVFETSPRVFLLAPPSIANSKAEKRRKCVLIPAMEKVAHDTGAHFVPSVALASAEMGRDGIHLHSAGAKLIATAVSSAIRPRASRFMLKQPQARSVVSSRNQQRALAAARQMGKRSFFAMSRAELRLWAKTYCIPFSAARKEQEVLEILAKIGVKRKVD